ncbi:MAG: HIRAN domain-containing protein [Candidatus Syntrophopropionicum ammoniitolerans]
MKGCQEILRELYEEAEHSTEGWKYKMSWHCGLIRQPDNPYDPNAIAVELAGEQVGFIPKALAAKLAPRIDAGEVYRVVDARIIKGGSNKDKPVFGVRIIAEAPAERKVG